MASIQIILVLSLITCWVLIPYLSRFAIRVGLVDAPDKSRKLHEKPIPMVGGLAVFFAASMAVAVAFGLTYFEIPFFKKCDAKLALIFGFPGDYLALRRIRAIELHQYLGLFLGSIVILTVGVLDDRFGIRGRQKLFGQFVAVTVLVLFGFRFDTLAFLGINIDLDIFSIVFIYGWVLASVNSVNLLDGADGIAGTIGAIMSFALMAMMLSRGAVVDTIVAAAIAGALIGFLYYNFPPASVYLGDAGSMLIGFVLSALAVRCTLKQNSIYAFAAPIALLAIPFIDTGAAIIRRRLTGRSIFAVDRGHLHHKLMKRGFGPRTSLVWVALLTTMSAAGGVMAMVLRQPEYAVLSIVCVLIVMIANQIFGVAETELVLKRAYGFSKKIVRKPYTSGQSDSMAMVVHVQGDLDWKSKWSQFNQYAEDHRLHQLTFDINAPWLHESFHAKYSSEEKVRESNYLWEAVLPLIADGRIFGSVSVKSSQDNPKSHREIIIDIMDMGGGLEKLILDATSPPTPVDITPGQSDQSGQITSVSK